MRSKRLRTAASRLFRSTSHGAAESSLFSCRLAVESLEDRRVLAAVSWDGGGDGINWSDGLNWSTNALPTSADDVTISVPGTITVTHASGNDTIRSLTSAENLSITGGNLTVTTGASSVSGTFNLAYPATLSVNGAEHLLSPIPQPPLAAAICLRVQAGNSICPTPQLTRRRPLATPVFKRQAPAARLT